MASSSTYQIYQALVDNLKNLKKVKTSINRLINEAIKCNDTLTIEVQTKMFGLTYSAWSEVRFLKMIYTPYGFSDEEIKQIINKSNIEEKWTKCLELAFSKYSNSNNSSELPNRKQRIERLVKEYIVAPSVLRNKIAHGQWIKPLNSKNAGIGDETIRIKLEKLSVTEITIWFNVNHYLCQIVEDLIESPDKAAHNHYYNHLTDLECYIKKFEGWELQDKIEKIKTRRPLLRRNISNIWHTKDSGFKVLEQKNIDRFGKYTYILKDDKGKFLLRTNLELQIGDTIDIIRIYKQG